MNNKFLKKSLTIFTLILIFFTHQGLSTSYSKVLSRDNENTNLFSLSSRLNHPAKHNSLIRKDKRPSSSIKNLKIKDSDSSYKIHHPVKHNSLVTRDKRPSSSLLRKNHIIRDNVISQVPLTSSHRPVKHKVFVKRGEFVKKDNIKTGLQGTYSHEEIKELTNGYIKDLNSLRKDISKKEVPDVTWKSAGSLGREGQSIFDILFDKGKVREKKSFDDLMNKLKVY